MDKNSVKTKVLSGLIWKFGERVSAQLVTFVVSTVLARLLDPSSYGTIAIVNIFIAIANVFVNSGFGNSLIQKKEADDLDFSSVFYFNVLMSVLMYMFLFVSAPFIADFFDMELLCPVLRVLGLRLIAAGINSVQNAYIAKRMEFKRFFLITIIGTVISAIVGIIMAYRGYGIWALVAQYMTNTTIDTVLIWIIVSWKPKFLFSFKRLGALFSYGWKLLISSLLDTGYGELRSLVIGRMYTAADLAYFNKGKSFPNLAVTNINYSIQAVLFPAMSEIQDERERVKAMTRRSIRVSGYIMFPIMTGIALVSEPLIKLLLTEKWLPCVPYLNIFCFTLALAPIHTANLQAIKAVGRSDIFLKLEIIKKIIGLTVLISVMRHGVIAIALSGIFTTITASIINSFPNKKLISYGYFQQLKDLFNCFVPLVAMAIAVIVVGTLNINDFLMISLQVIVGVCTYVLISYFTKNECFNYILSTIKRFFSNRG